MVYLETAPLNLAEESKFLHSFQDTQNVEMDISVAFSGDRRVLEDIKVLAKNNYGEDDFGNNLPLPEELTYLRK